MSYIGSVKFYKHLILTVLALIILLPYGLSIYLFVVNMNLKDEISTINANISSNNVLSLDMHLRNSIAFNNKDTIPAYNNLNQEVLPYQQKYEDLYVERNAYVDSIADEKTAYLTFDDGPSKMTLKILDLLDEYGIKATFFVVYKDDDFSLSIYKEIVERGHSIGLHTYSHEYKQIYSSVDAYLDDFYKLYKHIYEVTGIKCDIFRFPGGSINSYNTNIYREIIAEMVRRGFVFYDWNISSADAEPGSTKESIIRNIKRGLENQDRVIILMHDSPHKQLTYDTLPTVIDYLYEKDFIFRKLDNTVRPITFAYK